MKSIALDRSPLMLRGYLIGMDQWGSLTWIGKIGDMKAFPKTTTRVIMHPDDAGNLPVMTLATED